MRSSLKAKNAGAAFVLESIPNIGASLANDLRSIGINCPRDLIGRDPQSLYQALCARTASRLDPCVLDTFISAVRFMEGAPARPWWYYTPQRKKRLMKPNEQVICETPTPGKTAKRIDRWKYELVRKAILASLPRRGEGVLFRDLPSLVEQRVSRTDQERLGSVNWYTTTVKLALEVKGDHARKRRGAATVAPEIVLPSGSLSRTDCDGDRRPDWWFACAKYPG